MQPGLPNVLVVKLSSESHFDIHVRTALNEIDDRASRTDDRYFRNREFEDTADFRKYSARLSTVCILGWGGKSCEIIDRAEGEQPLSDNLRSVFQRLRALI